MKHPITISAELIRSALFGVAVGDALGVPVEFMSRSTLKKNPVLDMRGYGTYHQPPGTWSDDSSLTFCLAEALTEGYDLDVIAGNFVKWVEAQFWTPRGHVFDIGIATREAIRRLAHGVNPLLAGGTAESSNGNGSLMRILPLLFEVYDKPMDQRFEYTRQVSSITHGHIRSILACFYYLELALLFLEGKDKWTACNTLRTFLPPFFSSLSVPAGEIATFTRLLNGNIAELAEADIFSSGYVLHTLEASLWCLLTTDNYPDAVLKAVNLGEDTDTTAAVTGGLAGLLYGMDQIPASWINQLARKDDINLLADRLFDRVHKKG